MGPRNSSFPVRSLSILILAAIAALASGCVSYSRPYGHYGGHYGSSGCRSAYGCTSYGPRGYGYSSGHGYSSTIRRYETVYVPVYRDVHRHSYDGRKHWDRGWNGHDRKDRHDRDRDRKRSRNDDRRDPQAQPQPQPRQRQRIATPREDRPTVQEWRAERARRGQPAVSSSDRNDAARNAWRQARD